MTPKQLRAAIDTLTGGNATEMARVLGITRRAMARRLDGAEMSPEAVKLLRLMLAGRVKLQDVRDA